MAQGAADITIHIDEDLTEQQNEQLCDLLRGTDGVMKAQCAQYKNHLYVVRYDPRTIDATRILKQVSAQGWHAELIGM